MYADRNRQGRGFSPTSLGVALAANAAVVGALFLANPNIIPRAPDDTLVTDNIPVDPPPPPDPAKPKPRTDTKTVPEHVETVPAKVPTATDPTFPVPPLPPLPPQPPVEVGNGAGAGEALPPPPPALVDASVDPRYATQFQPDYPAEERRLERTGRVKVRVLIGVDGRVKQVEQVAATSDAFFRVTQQRALAKWRFRPATLGGVPVERWREMTVSFVLQD